MHVRHRADAARQRRLDHAVTERTIRVGYISASDPDELSYDFGEMLPEGLEMECAAPAEPVRVVTRDALVAAERGLDDAARQLVDRGVEAVVISIAPMIYVGGVGYDRVLIDRIHATTGLPVTTNQTAAVDALRALGVSRIALMNPNSSDLLDDQVRFFEDSGIAVDVAKSLDIADNRDIDLIEPATSLDFVVSAIDTDHPPEGVYLSGPCWRTLDIIETLEAELGVPVVSALQAMVWASMRLVDKVTKVHGYGQLLTIP
jgi:maleate cis-trans isomerase